MPTTGDRGGRPVAVGRGSMGALCSKKQEAAVLDSEVHANPVHALDDQSDEDELLLQSNSAGATAISALPGELETCKLLAACVPLAKGKVEIAGSFPLHVFQRHHESELRYSLPAWTYGDVDICFADCPDFEAAVRSFEEALARNGYRTTRQWLSRDAAGKIRLADYYIEGIASEISLINCPTMPTVVDNLNGFDISACCVSCIIDSDLTFEYSFGTNGFSPREDILSGNAHLRLRFSMNPRERIAKYKQRGFTTPMPMLDGAGEHVMSALASAADKQVRDMPEISYWRKAASSSPPRGTLLSELPVAGATFVTLNCECDCDGSNVEAILDALASADATVVCLQDVTVKLLGLLKQQPALTATYQVFSVMDEGDMVKASAELGPSAVHGQVCLTKVELVDYWSVHLEGPQHRRVDIAFGSGFAVANVHAESTPECEQLRLKQYQSVVTEMKAGMQQYGIDFGVLCGDLGVIVGMPECALLGEFFEDANISSSSSSSISPADTPIQRGDEAEQGRVLQLKPAVVRTCSWSANGGDGLAERMSGLTTLQPAEPSSPVHESPEKLSVMAGKVGVASDLGPRRLAVAIEAEG